MAAPLLYGSQEVSPLYLYRVQIWPSLSHNVPVTVMLSATFLLLQSFRWQSATLTLSFGIL